MLRNKSANGREDDAASVPIPMPLIDVITQCVLSPRLQKSQASRARVSNVPQPDLCAAINWTQRYPRFWERQPLGQFSRLFGV